MEDDVEFNDSEPNKMSTLIETISDDDYDGIDPFEGVLSC